VTAMSRQIFELTVQLTDGTVLKGSGRNLPATVERIYKAAQGKRPPHQVLLSRAGEEDEGYAGTYTLYFGTARKIGGLSDGTVEVAARVAQ
jgi:hypothetical protein